MSGIISTIWNHKITVGDTVIYAAVCTALAGVCYGAVYYKYVRPVVKALDQELEDAVNGKEHDHE